MVIPAFTATKRKTHKIIPAFTAAKRKPREIIPIFTAAKTTPPQQRKKTAAPKAQSSFTITKPALSRQELVH